MTRDEKIPDVLQSSIDVLSWTYRIGGVCAIVGAGLGMIGNLIHPATSGPDEPAATARVVADSGIWIPVHLGLIVAFVLMLLGLVAIHDSFSYGVARALARFGLAAALIGTAGAAVLLSLDGFAAKHLADSWASASPSMREDALAAFRAEDSINFALLSPLNLVFAGFTFVLFGLANALSDVYPRWLGWAAVAGGAGSAVSGVIQAFLGEPTGITQAAGIAGPSIITLWLLIIGVFLLRGRAIGQSHEAVGVVTDTTAGEWGRRPA